MFRKIKYTIEANKIVLYPSHFLTPVFIILYIVFMIMTIIILTNTGGAINTPSLIKTIGILAIVCALFFLLPAAIFSSRKLVFDAGAQEVYRQGLTGKRKLMSFADIADIVKRNTLNTNGYLLLRKGDLYGKGIFLSPAHVKKANAFETHVLPQINQLLRNAAPPVKTPATADSRNSGNTVAYTYGQFNYYSLKDNKYFVKGKGAVRYGISLFIVLILAGIFVALFADNRVTDDSDSIYRYILLLPIIVLSAMLSKRVYFDSLTKEFVVKYFGITFEKDPLEKFTNFLVTRKTHNGMHSGTDVRLKFRTNNNKEKKSSHLYDFKKTKNIEGFMEETQYIISAITGYKINRTH